jgi:hypothetical protein
VKPLKEPAPYPLVNGRDTYPADQLLPVHKTVKHWCYAKENRFGTSSSHGIGDAWYAIRFDSRQACAEWITKQATTTASETDARTAHLLGIVLESVGGVMTNVTSGAEVFFAPGEGVWSTIERK